MPEQSIASTMVAVFGAVRITVQNPGLLQEKRLLELAFEKIASFIRCEKRGGIIGYEMPVGIQLSDRGEKDKKKEILSYSLVQVFVGASLTLRTDPETQSIILIVETLPWVSADELYGQIKNVFPDSAITPSFPSRLYR